jgi:hypothetical protein
MLITFAPLLLLAQAADCPTEETASGRFRIRRGELSCSQQAKIAERDKIAPRPITASEKKRIIDHFDLLLVDGPSARWRWGNVVRGHVACFAVNSKNRMGGYAGWSRFTFDLETGEEVNIEQMEALLERLNMEGEMRDICN